MVGNSSCGCVNAQNEDPAFVVRFLTAAAGGRRPEFKSTSCSELEKLFSRTAKTAARATAPII
jgi:hypothetical protein